MIAAVRHGKGAFAFSRVLNNVPDPMAKLNVSLSWVFAKLKTLLRKTDPRSSEATWRGIGYLLGHFTPAECGHYLTNAGYASA